MSRSSRTNRERVLGILKSGANEGLCDDCISSHLEIYPRQQVNQICNDLKRQGKVDRKESLCNKCRKLKICNFLVTNHVYPEKTIVQIGWEENSPRKLGFRRFLAKYRRIFPERVERYAKDHWALTEDLEDHGQKIVNRAYSHPSMYMLFLLKVGIWKKPHGKGLQNTVMNIVKNSPESVDAAFQIALDIYHQSVKDKPEVLMEADRKLVGTFGKLQGFGAKSGSRKMVSAILRFLDPDKYGTVDYRNWAILSNTGGQFLEDPLLPPLAESLNKSRNVDIDTQKYLSYLKIIRKLAGDYDYSPADVDMALFAYTDEIVPLGREPIITPLPKESKDKAQRMIGVIEGVADSAERLGFPRQARRLLQNVKPKVRTGDYEGIYQYCRNAIRARPDMDAKLEKLGGKSLRSQFYRIQQIYES